ncbi:hypothetical protein C0992_004639 [Termitomyces sp. T32_za158]|nr:hypothetical protein C0992_004639 [Termitomyces sp. T32_za158]
MSSPSASTSFVSPAVLAAWSYVLKLDMFLASIVDVSPDADQWMVVGTMRVFEKWLWHKVANPGWFEDPAPPSIDEQLASLLADDGPFTLWTELSPDSKVAAYVKPLVQMKLACQEHKWAEAAAQSMAVMSAEREAELLEEWRVVLAELMARRMANARAAGFLEAKTVGVETGGEAVETGETVLQGAAAAKPEAAEELVVPVVEVVAAEKSADESATQDNKEADNEDEAPVTPKTVLTIGSSSPLPAVVKRASKSTTLSNGACRRWCHNTRYNQEPLPTPHINGQEFLWLRKALDYPISALQPSRYIEAAREKAEGIAEVMRKDMQAAAAEMEGLRLRKKIMA